HSYSWNFGDGATGNGAAPSHQYAAGNYTASVTVTPPSGTPVTVTVPVRVAAPANNNACGEMSPAKLFVVYSNASGSCNQASPNSRCQTGELVTFNVDVFNYNLGCATHTFSWDFGDGPNVVTKWVWDYGDGSSETVNSGSTTARTHLFPSAGTHTITLTASDASGQLAQASHTLGTIVSRTRRAAH